MSTSITQALIPNAMQSFTNADGTPLALGTVAMYQVGTSTPANTWADVGLTVLNPNPITLDASGRCVMFGVGEYRQVVYNAIGNLVWDRVTTTGLDPSTFTSISVAYDLPVYLAGLPDSGETYPIYNVVRQVTLPVGLVGSIFTVGINPTAAAVVTLEKNGSAIGTVSFATSGVPAISFPNQITFQALDQFTIGWPSPQDATAANFACTLVFTVVST